MAFVYLCIFFVLFVLYKLLHLNQLPEKPKIYGRDMRFVEYLVKSCPILCEGYIPTALWGKSGHVQTILHSVIGRAHVPRSEGERVFVTLQDGALLSFDLYEPYKAHHSEKDLTIVICPGIGNSSDTVYIQAFIHNAIRKGYRCAVLNHLGTLKSVPVKTPRIFSYGGTGELETMVRQILKRYRDTRVICVGFSMGGNIITKFLASSFFDEAVKPAKSAPSAAKQMQEAVDIGAAGDCPAMVEDAACGSAEEDEERAEFVDTRRVVAGISICQGYDAVTTAESLLQWDNLRRVYVYFMTGGMKNLLNKHKSVLLSDEAKERYGLDEARIFAATSLKEFDEAYTRRIFGFETVDEMYRAMSSFYVLKQIKRPIVFINSADDPIVPEALMAKIRSHVEQADQCVFVETLHGGHLAFFEGGVLIPRKHGWLDRVALQLADSLIAYVEAPSAPLVSSPTVRRRANIILPNTTAVAPGLERALVHDEEEEDEVVVQRRPPAISLKHLSSLAC